MTPDPPLLAVSVWRARLKPIMLLFFPILFRFSSLFYPIVPTHLLIPNQFPLAYV